LLMKLKSTLVLHLSHQLSKPSCLISLRDGIGLLGKPAGYARVPDSSRTPSANAITAKRNAAEYELRRPRKPMSARPRPSA
jgi:hypothetical protein